MLKLFTERYQRQDAARVLGMTVLHLESPMHYREASPEEIARDILDASDSALEKLGFSEPERIAAFIRHLAYQDSLKM